MQKLSVFLVDDHTAVREGLKLLINAQPDMEVIGQAGDGRAALPQIRQCRPDIVLMDFSMPEMNGAQTTERLRQECPTVAVLALTRHSDQGYFRQLLQAGAAGYVLKKAAPDELINAIRIVAGGGTYFDPTLAGHALEGFIGRQAIKNVAKHDVLSERETEVLRLIAWGHSNKEIAAQLGISIKTVEYHKARSMEKLDIHSRVDIVRYALGRKWLVDT